MTLISTKLTLETPSFYKCWKACLYQGCPTTVSWEIISLKMIQLHFYFLFTADRLSFFFFAYRFSGTTAVDTRKESIKILKYNGISCKSHVLKATFRHFRKHDHISRFVDLVVSADVSVGFFLTPRGKSRPTKWKLFRGNPKSTIGFFAAFVFF